MPHNTQIDECFMNLVKKNRCIGDQGLSYGRIKNEKSYQDSLKKQQYEQYITLKKEFEAKSK